jgi:hypothetical protein
VTPGCSAGQGGAFDSRWMPPVGGAPSRHTGTGGAATGVQSQVPEATQVLGTRESGSAPSGSQAKSSGAPKQAARQPDEAMSSGASGWASSQPRRCAGRQAGAHRRGEEAPTELPRSTASELDSYVLRSIFSGIDVKIARLCSQDLSERLSKLVTYI